MNEFVILGTLRRRALYAFLLVGVLVLALAAAAKYAIPMEGIPWPDVGDMNTGWYYEEEGELNPVGQLPCQVEHTGDKLYLVHDLDGVALGAGDVLAVQTRYQSIRVWADGTLVYESAQGQEYALSSMWHFIPAEFVQGADSLRLELTKYDSASEWNLFPVLQDHPAAVAAYLLADHLPAILMWIYCMVLTLLLAVILLFLWVRKIPGGSLVLALAAFIFLSGTWILLDSKVTTVMGGNYAMTYFLSYSAFYLLPIPLLFYFQLMLEERNRFLQALTWITVGNAGLWMLLHLLSVVSIRDTVVTVHGIILVFLADFIVELPKWREERRKNRLTYTFWGILLVFAAAAVSIGLYYAGLLPPTNSAVLYAWGLLALILCMIMDTVAMFGRVWKEKRHMEIYRQLATEDSMTGLSNRNAYELRLRELVYHPPGELGMVLFDIDRMKFINDTYGHHMGDLVIALVGRCIRKVFGSSGECYRIGGDEFCVIYTGQMDMSANCDRLDQLLERENHYDFPVKVSCGWELRDLKGEASITFQDILALKTAADEMLYRQKKAHGGRP